MGRSRTDLACCVPSIGSARRDHISKRGAQCLTGHPLPGDHTCWLSTASDEANVKRLSQDRPAAATAVGGSPIYISFASQTSAQLVKSLSFSISRLSQSRNLCTLRPASLLVKVRQCPTSTGANFVTDANAFERNSLDKGTGEAGSTPRPAIAPRLSACYGRSIARAATKMDKIG